MYLVISNSKQKGPLSKQTLEMCPGEAEVRIMINDPRIEVTKVFKCEEENLLPTLVQNGEEEKDRREYERLKKKFENKNDI